MGRIVDLCGVIAESAQEGPEGLTLPADEWQRLSDEFTEEEIEDALSLVNESLYHGELVDAADSLSARLVEVLGAFADAKAFEGVAHAGTPLTIEVVGQLARRVARLEEVLQATREGSPPDRSGFDALRKRLADYGIEEEMRDDEDEGTLGEDD
jgi:hypothetical protein